MDRSFYFLKPYYNDLEEPKTIICDPNKYLMTGNGTAKWMNFDACNKDNQGFGVPVIPGGIAVMGLIDYK